MFAQNLQFGSMTPFGLKWANSYLFEDDGDIAFVRSLMVMRIGK